MRDRLITALTDRVTQFREQGDESLLFGEEAAEQAAGLREFLVREDASDRGAVSVEVLDALAAFHLTRHQARPGADGFADYGSVLRLLLLRCRIHSEDVPESLHTAAQDANRLAREAHTEALRLLREHQRTGAAEPLDKSVGHFRIALGLGLGGEDVPGLPLSHLSGALMQRYTLGRRLADLDEAIELREESIKVTDTDNPELPRRLTLLSLLLGMRYKRTGQRADLERAVSVGRDGVTATPLDSHARPRRLRQLAGQLHSRYEYTYDLADLEEAVGHAKEAVATARPDDPDRMDYAAGLTQRMKARYDRLGDPADLDMPVEVLRSLLATAPEALRPTAQTQLAAALHSRHERTGDLADLESLIDLERQALEATAPSDPDRGRRLANHSISYRFRSERLNSPEDLEEAIRLGTEAVSVRADYPFALYHLGQAFLIRYRRTFERADLDRAIQLGTKAIDAYPDVSPSTDRAVAMAYLAEALETRLLDDEDQADLDEAVEWRRKAAATIPRSHSNYGAYPSMLSDVLLRRHRETQSPADLEEAIRTAEEAVTVTPRTHRTYRALITTLASALAARHSSRPDALDRPVALVREAASLAQGDDDIYIARARRRLGDMLRRRYQHRDDPADLREAIDCWRSVDDVPGAALDDRLASWEACGTAGVALGDHALAAEAFDRAVLLLPQLAWHGLPRETREKHLADWSGLASAAATSHVLAGAPERALEILEQGRTIIRNQMLHIRGDLSRLAEREPALAAALQGVRDRLDAQGPASGIGPPDLPAENLLAPLGREQRARERAALYREWDELLAKARGLEGFEYFLAPVPYEELRAAAAHGPVVVVNVSTTGHALVIRDATGPVEVVALPDVTVSDVAERAMALLNVLIAGDRRQRPFLRRERDRHTVHDVLEWLWDRIAEPVLDHLGLAACPDGEMPRLWWCPTGLLTLLPLHAAGRYPRHRVPAGTAGEAQAHSVPGRVVSSYIPTLTALRRARENGAGGGDFGGLLAVAMPRTPGLPSLPGVERECEELFAHFPPDMSGLLVGPEATREQVRRGLHENSWVHFACHAEQDFNAPSQSAFVLHDDRLTTAELFELDLPHAELAYLSACETASGGGGMPDEAIHLASTMQLAGYRHVIATLWSIQDGSAPDVAARFYAALTRTGRPDATDAARALHSAVAEQRAQDPTDPLRWAAYLHVGP